MKIFTRKPRPVPTVPVQPTETVPSREFILATLQRSEAAQRDRLHGTGLRAVRDNLR